LCYKSDVTAFVAFLVFAATAAQPAFEVASIKPGVPFTQEAFRAGQAPQIGEKIDGARATFRGLNLVTLIARAYGVKVFQVSGPDWTSRDIYDIAAKLPEGATPDQVPQMLQTLLADRFHLTLRRETKEFPVYALVVGNADKLTPRPPDYDSTVKGAIRPMTLESYAALAGIGLDRPVLDFTGMKGEYLLPMEDLLRAAMRQRAARLTHVESDEGGPTAFVVVQAYGLKLEPRKLALPDLIIEHAEKPTEN
jgi:uncharacterized protein (TIGR03435 family)